MKLILLALLASVMTSSPSKISKMELNPGDEVVIADGTYENVSIKLPFMGTEAAPITIKAQTPGGVTFSGKSTISVEGSFINVEGFRFEKQSATNNGYLKFSEASSRCRVTNCLFDGSESDMDAQKHSFFVVLRGSRNEVSHCSFLDKKTIGVTLAVNPSDNAEEHHLICNNYFYRPYIIKKDGHVENGQESIRCGNSQYSMKDVGCVIRDNWFYHCDGEIETISNKSCFNLIEHNLLDECMGSITLRHGNDCTVRDNYINGNGRKNTGGIRIIGERHVVENNKISGLRNSGGTRSAISAVKGFEAPKLHEYFQVKGALIKGNYIYDCDYAIQIGVVQNKKQVLAPTGVKVEGNTVVCTKDSQHAVSLIDMEGGDVTWKKNLIYGGIQEEISLKKAKGSPKHADWSAEMQKIRDNAGVTFSVKKP